MSDRCEYCEGSNVCPEKYIDDSSVWMCTRERGHTGNHVACAGSGDHNLYQWRNDATGAYARPIRKPSCDGSTSTCGPECWQSDVGATMDSLAAEAIASETDRRILADLPAASPWVRASERQPHDHWQLYLVRRSVLDPSPGFCRPPFLPDEQWLDLAIVEHLAAENDRLREELVNEREVSGARIAKLEADNRNLEALRERIACESPETTAEKVWRYHTKKAAHGCCSDCRFFDGKADMGGNCHRHPQARPIAFPEIHWCGEFDPKEATLS